MTMHISIKYNDRDPSFNELKSFTKGTKMK